MSAPPATPPPPARRSGTGFFGRLLTTLLVIIVSVALAIAAVGALAFYVFGFAPETPTLVALSQRDLQSLRQQNSVLQTQVADLASRADSDREDLQDIATQVRGLGDLNEQIRRYDGVAATVQAEAQDSRTAVAAYASAIATRIAQVDQLQQRTDRIGRFLERLGDLASDTASDLGAAGTPGTITPTTVATETQAPMLAASSMPSPIATVVVQTVLVVPPPIRPTSTATQPTATP